EFCCATCRILNRGRADKTRPKRESHCRTVSTLIGEHGSFSFLLYTKITPF
ncbi:hypothetical protein KIN20_010679, partial [Parelaphostrongylus tenuis]